MSKTPEQAAHEAQQAERLMEHPMIVEFFAAYDAEIIAKWKLTPARDADAREFLWGLMQASGRFKQIMQRYMEDGKLARRDLEMKRKGFLSAL